MVTADTSPGQGRQLRDFSKCVPGTFHKSKQDSWVAAQTVLTALNACCRKAQIPVPQAEGAVVLTQLIRFWDPNKLGTGYAIKFG